MERECNEMRDLIQAVLRRIKSDSSEIVSKTGKKLILELQKCYPVSFKTQYLDKVKTTEDQKICSAVLDNDDELLKKVIAGESKE